MLKNCVVEREYKKFHFVDKKSIIYVEKAKKGVFVVEKNRIPEAGDFYLHFKNKLYQIITVATHSETRESLVIYQALYGDYGVFARPLDMFLSEVDHNKYPEVQQKYRFQYIPKSELTRITSSKGVDTEKIDCEHSAEQESDTRRVENNVDADVKSENRTLESKKRITTKKTLSDFLDADTTKQKLEILELMRSDIDDFTLDSMAICLDYVTTGDTIEEKYDSIYKYLKMRQMYENRR